MGRDTLEKEIRELKKQVKRLKEQQDRDWNAQFAGYPGYD